MASIGRLSRRLRLLARSERGMALPAALLATVISFSLAGAAVVSSIDSQRGTARDQGSKNAIAAADAGASIAMMRLDRYTASLSSSTPCLGVSSNTLALTAASGDGWCPAITGTVGGSTYSYRVTPQAAKGSTMIVISTGTAGSVSRRIAISLGATTVGSALLMAGVIGQDSITLSNSADIRVGVGTNGNVSLDNNSTICGDIRHGVGKNVTFNNGSSQCSGYSVSEGNQTLPAVSTFIPTDIATNNSDYRLVKCVSTNNPVGCQLDGYSAQYTSTVPWNPTTRTISTDKNASLTLTGGDYFICSLVLSNNSHLIMGQGAKVRLFFDTPENCGLSAGASQISVSNNADISATGYQPTQDQFDVMGLYLMGSTSIPTTINFSNNTGTNNEFVLYAPNTDIVINNKATYTGVIAGKTVSIPNNATIRQDSGFVPPQIGGATLYARQSYVECTGATASPPNANC